MPGFADAGAFGKSDAMAKMARSRLTRRMMAPERNDKAFSHFSRKKSIDRATAQVLGEHKGY
jgi:hypothetical protein